MNAVRLAAALGLAALLAGCASGRHEDAKLRMPWPLPPPAPLLAYAEPKDNYPTIGGDILKGTSPQEQEAMTATAMTPPPRPAPATPEAPIRP